MIDLPSLAEVEEVDLLVGFFDLTGFADWSKRQSARSMYDLAARLFAHCDDLIHQADGYLVKSIGDAGLFIFAGEDLDKEISALLELKSGCDLWLAAEGYPGKMTLKIHAGSVACGFFSHRSGARFDVYGETVNHAAMMKGWDFMLSESVYASLSVPLKQKFNLEKDEKIAFFSGI